MTEQLKLYKCLRYTKENEGDNWWEGGLIIFAETPEEAKAIFEEQER